MVRLSTQKKLSAIHRDPVKTAKAAGLRYTSEKMPGWHRRRKGETFTYTDDAGKKCTDQAVLDRIRKLVLPPAWENVWICADEDGHLQATGVDVKGRKQYRYHPAWNSIRSQTKYARLPQFAEALPLIRQRLEHDLKIPGFSYHKILALTVSVLEQTHIRIGNEEYKKMNGSFGLTTLQNKHVKVDGIAVRFEFKGKKGVFQALQMKSRRLARLIRQCRELPGKELFQYIDDQGKRHAVGSGDVNTYLKEISGMDFTAKDFRTWAGTVTAFQALRDLGPFETATAGKSNLVQMFDSVASKLGNTRAVCKKYYIHPAMLSAYENGTFFKKRQPPSEATSEKPGLSPDEMMVRDMLLDFVWD